MNPTWGLSVEQLDAVETILRKSLSQKDSFSIDVFGSRARGDHRKYSDLDLWIESSPPVTPSEIATMSDLFEESELPITVDLVSDETVLSEYRAGIVSEKKSWLRK